MKRINLRAHTGDLETLALVRKRLDRLCAMRLNRPLETHEQIAYDVLCKAEAMLIQAARRTA